ncbi:MAG: alpha/beta hydrolase [Bacteroidetes bacterium]|nr:MAG: alpha/beta hydrolase [Bacteroidota bacterium]
MLRRFHLLFVTAFFAAVSLSAQNPVPYGNNSAAGKYAEVNGIKMYYEIYGAGQPLLLLHGNGGSIGGRKKEIPEFAKKYKVIAVDSRCHGKTGCGVKELTYELMASDVKKLLDQLKIDSCLVWGHSDGGILGLILAYKYPEKIKRLVTSGANLQPDSSAVFPELIKMGTMMYAQVPDTMARKHMRLLLEQPHIPFDSLKKIKAPVLVMAGDRDAIREEHTVKIFQSIPNSQLCILPGTTHFVAKEKPELFMMIVTDFFEKPFAMPSMVKEVQKMLEPMSPPGKKSGK